MPDTDTSRSAKADIRERVAHESQRRARLGVPATAGGVLYLLSTIILSAALSKLPTVGLVQGLSPALNGRAEPAVSPRAAEVRYISHNAFGLISGSVLSAIAVGLLVLVLLFILQATRFRRPETWPAAHPLVLVGGTAVALLGVVHQVVLALEAHSFSGGHDFSNAAVDRALLTAGSGGVILGLAGLVAALALTVGMIAAMVASMRAGLLPRWLSVLGILAGLLFLPLFGTTSLQLIPTFWMVSTGIMLMGRLPGGDPPAWAAGEARPWPTQADRRAERNGQPVGRESPPKAQPAEERRAAQQQPGDQQAGEPAVKEPAMPQAARSRGRRRKRGR
jgi:hypothetical protein